MSLFVDTSESALERALDGLSMRQQVTANNIANSLTPGYHAQSVDFESSLSDALANGDPQDAQISVQDSGDTPGPDGNSVSMEKETTTLMRTNLQYQAAIDAVNFKLGVLRQAIEGH